MGAFLRGQGVVEGKATRCQPHVRYFEGRSLGRKPGSSGMLLGGVYEGEPLRFLASLLRRSRSLEFDMSGETFSRWVRARSPSSRSTSSFSGAAIDLSADPRADALSLIRMDDAEPRCDRLIDAARRLALHATPPKSVSGLPRLEGSRLRDPAVQTIRTAWRTQPAR